MCVCSLSYAASKAHVPYHIVISGLSGSIIFFHIISYAARFSEKQLLNMKRVFWFPLHIFSAIFLIVKIMDRDIIITVRNGT